MTRDEQGQSLTYDAWGRLTQVGGQGYQSDALGRRIKEGSTDLYYSDRWQVIEERVGGVAKAQNVWSDVYVDAMVLRDRDADGSTGNGLEQRSYLLHDANFNVTGVTDAAGQVIERYRYDAYGKATVLEADFSLDADGQSDVGNVYLHQGLRLDAAAGLYHARNRDYDAELGRWTRQDPAGFMDGSSLYVANSSSPINKLDPSGLNPLRDLWEWWWNDPHAQLATGGAAEAAGAGTGVGVAQAAAGGLDALAKGIRAIGPYVLVQEREHEGMAGGDDYNPYNDPVLNGLQKLREGRDSEITPAEWQAMDKWMDERRNK